MHTGNSIIMRAPKERIFETAPDGNAASPGCQQIKHSPRAGNYPNKIALQ
jgi:hypothetical protein